jgi:hypothetical protein
MTAHPNQTKAQDAWDAIAKGDLGPAGALTSPTTAMHHGPGAGPFAGPGQGLDRLLEMALYFDEVFAGTFHQDGRCVYADDDCAVNLVRETGTTPDGTVFDNRAIWINRFGGDGLVDGIWTIDLDDAAMRAFWAGRDHADVNAPAGA